MKKVKLRTLLLIFFLFLISPAYSKDSFYLKDKTGNIYMLEMSVQEFEETLGQVISKDNLWENEEYAIQPYYSSEFAREGIKIKYLQNKVCEIEINSQDFELNDFDIGIGSSISDLEKKLGKGVFSLDVSFNDEKQVFDISNKIISYKYDDTELKFNINPAEDICTGFKLILMNGDIKITDSKGNKYNLGMPVERVYSFLGDYKIITDLWKDKNIQKSYYLVDFNNCSFLFFKDIEMQSDEVRVDQMVFASEEYKIDGFDVGCGSSFNEIYKVFGKNTLRDKYEFNQRLERQEHRIEYHCKGIEKDFVLGFVFDVENNLCVSFYLTSDSDE